MAPQAATKKNTEPTTAEVRAWAWDQGYDVGDRGRLPYDVLLAWNKSHRARKVPLDG